MKQHEGMTGDYSVVKAGGPSAVSVVGAQSPDSGESTHYTDDRFQPANLTEKQRDVLEREDFIIYGVASIEQWDNDTPSDKISIDALEKELPNFFERGGLISTGHRDIPVGKALKEYTLDKDVTIEVDGEQHSFDSGETIKTEVKGDKLWLIANIYGKSDKAGSSISYKTRLGAYHGKYDGFSITGHRNEYTETPMGKIVSDIDFLSTTIGKADTIKNPGSEFGVVAIKEFANEWEPYLQTDSKTMFKEIANKLLGSDSKEVQKASTEALAEESIRHALTESVELETATKAVVEGEDDYETILQKAEADVEEIAEKADGSDEFAEAMEEVYGVPANEVADMLHSYVDMGEETAEEDTDSDEENTEKENYTEDEEDEESDESDDEDSEEEDVEKSETEAEDEPEYITKEEFDTRLDELKESVSEAVQSRDEDLKKEIAQELDDNIVSKLETGASPEQDDNPADDGTSRNLYRELTE